MTILTSFGTEGVALTDGKLFKKYGPNYAMTQKVNLCEEATGNVDPMGEKLIFCGKAPNVNMVDANTGRKIQSLSDANVCGSTHVAAEQCYAFGARELGNAVVKVWDTRVREGAFMKQHDSTNKKRRMTGVFAVGDDDTTMVAQYDDGFRTYRSIFETGKSAKAQFNSTIIGAVQLQLKGGVIAGRTNTDVEVITREKAGKEFKVRIDMQGWKPLDIQFDGWDLVVACDAGIRMYACGNSDVETAAMYGMQAKRELEYDGIMATSAVIDAGRVVSYFGTYKGHDTVAGIMLQDIPRCPMDE